MAYLLASLASCAQGQGDGGTVDRYIEVEIVVIADAPPLPESMIVCLSTSRQLWTKETEKKVALERDARGGVIVGVGKVIFERPLARRSFILSRCDSFAPGVARLPTSNAGGELSCVLRLSAGSVVLGRVMSDDEIGSVDVELLPISELAGGQDGHCLKRLQGEDFVNYAKVKVEPNGEFRLRGIAAGRYWLRARSESGYVGWRAKPVEVGVGDQVIDASDVHAHKPGRIVVEALFHGQVVAGANVSILEMRDDYPLVRSAVSDARGLAVFDGIPPGVFLLGASKGRRGSPGLKVLLAAGEIVKQRIETQGSTIVFPSLESK